VRLDFADGWPVLSARLPTGSMTRPDSVVTWPIFTSLMVYRAKNVFSAHIGQLRMQLLCEVDRGDGRAPVRVLRRAIESKSLTHPSMEELADRPLPPHSR